MGTNNQNQKQLMRRRINKSLPSLFHLCDGDPSLGCDAHDLGGNAQRFISIEESHACYGVIYLADNCIALRAQIADDLIDAADRQAESHVLNATCRILREIVVKHALAGKRLYELYEYTAGIDLGSEPFGGHQGAMIGHAEVLCAHKLRLRKAGDGEGT